VGNSVQSKDIVVINMVGTRSYVKHSFLELLII